MAFYAEFDDAGRFIQYWEERGDGLVSPHRPIPKAIKDLFAAKADLVRHRGVVDGYRANHPRCVVLAGGRDCRCAACRAADDLPKPEP